MTSPGVGASAGFLGNGAGSRQLRVRWRSHLVTRSSVALTHASIDGSGGKGLEDKMHVYMYMMTLMGRVEKVAAVASSGGSPQQVSW